ncbi:hypothetical protein GCM10028791_27580 [Echinicola sediminis]
MGLAIGTFWYVDADAQEVRDCDNRNGQREKSILNAPVEDAEEPMIDGYRPEKMSPNHSSKTVKEVKENPVYKASGEKEEKKEEMSTLSFNLFLYIVDRFKED